jgi:hypothetical protein
VWLSLMQTRVTGAGFKHITGGLANLEGLFLYGSQVGDEGLIHLRNCKKLKTLRGSNKTSGMGVDD